MGCTQSRIENEEAVARCKERKQHMKEAVSARNAFAAAHSSYTMSLKNSGAALSDYAIGEAHAAGSHHPPQPNASSSSAAIDAPPQPPIVDSFPPPPPPPSNFLAAPLQRAATMPEISIPIPEPSSKPKPKPIMEEDEEEEEAPEGSSNLRRRRRGGSRGGSRGGGGGGGGPAAAVEEGPPPSMSPYQHQYDYFFDYASMPRPTLSEMEEVGDRSPFNEMPKRAEVVEEMRSGGGAEKVEAMKEPAVAPEKPVREDAPLPPPPPEAAVAVAAAAAAGGKSLKKGKQVVVGPGSGQVKRPNTLLQIFSQLDDHFLKASESAHEVSKMLEATRLHYHSNFADNRGHIDHSARVMRVITWNRSFKGLPNHDDGKDDFDTEEHETHATVLDKLLAWEKKLYDEVKAGEAMKFEYQRKVNSLNKLKKRGTNSDALEKAKASVSLLHTRYIVDMQAMDSTVSEINRLRDEQLYPKLVHLVDGMATMWETMRHHHESQSKFVQALKYIDITQALKETSEHHHNTTRQLGGVVNEWCRQFEKLVQKQRDYIRSLNTWLTLNLIPTESSLKEKVSSPPRPQNPPIKSLLLSWQEHLENLPDEVARPAITNFAAVIDTIVMQQEEEMRLRERCEDSRKELFRKTRAFEDWYRKYSERIIPDELENGRAEGNNNDAVMEKQLAVDLVKKRLEEEQEAYKRHCRQVREKSLVSLKARLPELFTALTDFSISCSAMYSDLRSKTQTRNRAESSA